MFSDPVYSIPIHSIFSSCLCQSLEIIHLFMIQPDQYQYHSQIRATYVLVNLSIHKGIKDSHIRIKSEMLFLKTPIITAAYNNLMTFQVSRQFIWDFPKFLKKKWLSGILWSLCLSICPLCYLHFISPTKPLEQIQSKDMLSDLLYTNWAWECTFIILAPW